MNTTHKNWVRHLLLGTSVVSIMSVAGLATAQQAEPEEEQTEELVDEVVVTGFRSSLEKAQDIKFNADTFVDAITAEDIGALPDRSVAEALQRVPGVNISRFEQADDPDRFSVEGSGVVIRGLPFVRSELNGRDIFSANGGRNLSFNDVSPELLGAVEVFKNTTADMIDGGISGTVNLITRKPLDRAGFHLAGTVEANYGDLADEFAPAFSVLGSNSWDTKAGTFGLQFGYAQSELISRTDASQITDPCYRASTLDGGCFRVRPVNSGGIVGGQQNFDETNFPPAGSVVVPKGAGIRTTTFDRDRRAISAIGQWESNNGELLATVEYLRADAEQTLDEFSILALVNDDNLFPVPAPGQSLVFNDGVFESGVLTQAGPGIPTENLRFQQRDDAQTEDFSFDLKWTPTDKINVNFEAQHIKSDNNLDGIIGALQTYSDIFLDISEETPVVEFRPPAGSTQNTFDDPNSTFYWFLLDNQVRNTGELTSFRGDVDYDFGNNDSFLKSARFGARWADRNRVTRSANFSNWGHLSAPWTGGGAVFANDPVAPGASALRTPFQDFQRGEVTTPIPGGSAFFYGGDDFVGEYLAGTTEQQASAITAQSQTPIPWGPISARGNLVDGTPFTAGEISDVDEETLAFYGRVDFGTDNFFSAGKLLEGNIGVRYVDTTIITGGSISFPTNPPMLDQSCDPATVPPGGSLPGFCLLSDSRQAEFLGAFTGETIVDDADISFDHWLPSFNAKLGMTDEVFLRLGISKGISRPDLGAFRTGGALSDNTNDLRQAGTLETGPLFQVFTGNRNLKPVESWNFDLSAEWYFDDVGSFTASAFRKELSNLVTFGPSFRELTTESGVTQEVEVNGPANDLEGSLYGFEFAYQQTYDFLPGLLSGLGLQATYTYVNAEDLSNSTLGPQRSDFASNLALSGVSEDTINITGFYENDKISARLAYNWRSDYVLTPRDVIFPFSPIISESTGQLDGSFFYNLTDEIKLGVQAVNLLDEVTRTSQVIDFDGTTVGRSAFRNDRRFSFLARFEF